MSEVIWNYLQSLNGVTIYSFIFIASFLECSALIGLLIPATFVVIFAGILASQGIINPIIAFLAVFIGGYSGDIIGYILGSYFRKPLVGYVKTKLSKINIDGQLQSSQEFLEKWGYLAIIIGQFFGPLRSLLPFTMGSLRYPRISFLLLDIIGIFILMSVLFGIGWFTANSFMANKEKILSNFYEITLVMGLIIFLIIIYKNPNFIKEQVKLIEKILNND